LYAAGAVALTIAAVSFRPEARQAEIFSDSGETLFPGFRDVAAARTIEVIEYDPEEAVARPLKVEFRKNRWVISSHNDYPAEAKDRLAKTAAALLDLKKDIVVTDRVEDHAKYGVVDPLDAKVATLTGRGKRLTLRDAAGMALADVIIGDAVKERPGYRYLRLPNQKRVYAVKTDADASAQFADWAEPNLLRINPADVRAVTILNYSLNPEQARVGSMERMLLSRTGEEWKLDGGTAVPAQRMQPLLGLLANLRVLGARPKPQELADQLKQKGPLQMTLTSMMSLRQRGFFLTPEGRLLASEGETLVDIANGVTYTLRYGDIATSQSDAAPAAKGPATNLQANRFLWVTASFDASRATRYGGNAANGEAQANALRTRFADWYYVIRPADFDRLRPKRPALLK
jgi:hypothetical protein